MRLRHALGPALALAVAACGGSRPGLPVRAAAAELPRPVDPCVAAGACLCADDWNAAFARARSPGFRRSDAGDTIRLPGGSGNRTLWLFGDTDLGADLPVINNSIAVSDQPGGRFMAPKGPQIRFYARGPSSAPPGVPVDVTSSVPPGVSAWFPGGPEGEAWLWPSGGAAVDGNKLYVLHQAIGCEPSCALGAPSCCVGKRVTANATCASTTSAPVCGPGEAPCAAWGSCAFASMRVRHTIVSAYGAVDRPPDEWQASPPVALADRSQSPPLDPAASPLRVAWGLAVAEDGPWIYLLGFHHPGERAAAPRGAPFDGAPSTIHVARVAPAELTDYAAWQFLGASSSWIPGPATDVRALKTLFGASSPPGERGPAECSFERVTFRGESRWVLVHGQALVNDQIVIRTARSLEGDDLAHPAYAYAAHAADPEAAPKGGAIWAVKAHADLARIDEPRGEYWLLVSYWSGALAELRFQWFPLHRLRPWCAMTGHECLG
jgi:hypothetical protein